MSGATTTRPRRKYLGIDPGRSKCGFAVVYDDGERARIDVVPVASIGDAIDAEVRTGSVDVLCIGDATSSDAIVEMCKRRWPDISRTIVDETNTTLEARQLYYTDHPPRGLWRFVPRGLLVPPVPLDGYAALLIVDRYRRELSKSKD
jgi:hypothetical protein